MDEKVIKSFYGKYNKEQITLETSSPPLGMLNSGFQLLWLKEKKKEIFKEVSFSLHLPNYLAFLYHDKVVSDYTSMGCHTALWDFNNKHYHQWVREELSEKQLPTPVSATTTFFRSEALEVGVGIHDSSAALLPYLVGVKEHFILISTGTWSITLNPFNRESLTMEELNQDCLEFLSVEGEKVKAARLFLGHEFSEQLKILNTHFELDDDYFKSISFDKKVYQSVKQDRLRYFVFTSFGEGDLSDNGIHKLKDFVRAYHQLIWELVAYQLKALDLAIGQTDEIETVFIDGGFSKNDVFCQMLKNERPSYTWKRTSLAAGSALGAAIAVNQGRFTENHFKRILQVENI